MSYTSDTQLHYRDLNRATLRAEAERIRYLRDRRRRELAYARRPETKDDEAQRARSQARRLRNACGCPSERARCALLALAYLKGMPYLQVEATTRTSKYYLHTCIAKEVAAKAGTSWENVQAWMRVDGA